MQGKQLPKNIQAHNHSGGENDYTTSKTGITIPMVSWFIIAILTKLSTLGVVPSILAQGPLIHWILPLLTTLSVDDW